MSCVEMSLVALARDPQLTFTEVVMKLYFAGSLATGF
jgi:hypothetical protein